MLKLSKRKKNTAYPLVDTPQPQIKERRSWRFVAMECIAVFLASIVLAISIGSVEQAEWMRPQPPLMTMMILGLILSFILAKVRVPGLVSIILAVVFGILVTLWQSAVLFPDSDLISAVNQLVFALQASMQMLTAGSPIEGTVHFAVFLMLVSWFTGFFSVRYIIKNHNCWLTLILSLLIILVNLANLTEQYYISFFYFLIASILLMAATHVLRYPGYLDRLTINSLGRKITAILVVMLCFSTGMVLIIWFIPEIQAAPITSTVTKSIPFKEDINDFFYNFFAKIPSKQPIKSSGLSGILSLTDPVDLSDTPHFAVNSKKSFYWRVHVYDTYINNGWKNSSIATIDPVQGKYFTVSSENSTRYSEITFTVTNKIKTDIVLYTGKLVSIDIPFTYRTLEPAIFNINLIGAFRDSALPEDVVSVARTLRLARTVDKPFGLNSINLRLPSDLVLKSIGEDRSAPTEENMEIISKERPLTVLQLARKLPVTREIIAVVASSAQAAGQQYSGVSKIYSPSAGELMKAGENYPYDITDYYLQLPSTFPDRIRQQVKTITRDVKSPYEKVMAIKQYLSQFNYTPESTESIPDGMDAIDYFLNSKKTGNCFYFASAEVVMLRSIGIPARIVIGYLPGDWDADSGTAVVMAKNYHSWVEVYFPDHGWIEFEVTPNVTNNPDIGFAEGVSDIGEEFLIDESIELPSDSSTGAVTTGFDFRYIFAGIIIIFFTVGFLIWFWIRKNVRLNYASRIFRYMSILGTLARLGPAAQQTPHEYCSQLVQAMPDGVGAINTISRYYTENRYSPVKDMDMEHKNELEKQWHIVRKLLLRKLLIPWNLKS